MFILIMAANKLSRNMTAETAKREKPKPPAPMITTVSCPLEGAQPKKLNFTSYNRITHILWY